MSKEEHVLVPDNLSHSSPLLAEVAGLLAHTSLIAAGIPAGDSDVVAGRADFASAKNLSDQVAVVSAAAPDVALAAPQVALAGV